jgi:hypothetical protein
MTKEWKRRQEDFHQMHHEEIEDWLEEKSYQVIPMHDDALAQEVIRHFQEDVRELIYPAKSYMVAIVYAQGLAKHFGENFFEALNDPDLLAGLDPWFRPYSEHKNVYDKVLTWLDERSPEFEMPWQAKETERYFRQEFLLEVKA